MRSASSLLSVLVGLSAFGQFTMLDAEFSGDGRITTDLGSNGGRANAMLAAPSGGFFVAGESQDYAGSCFVLLKFFEDGTLNSAFGVDGIVLAPFALGPSKATAMALQSDGRIVLAGTVSNGTDDDFAAARFMPDGSLDPSFGNDGQVVLPIGPEHDKASGVALLPDGRIVIGGTMNNEPDADFAMSCLLPDGTLDPTFGEVGIKLIPVGPGYDAATALVGQPDGRLLLAGYSYVGIYSEIVIVGVLPNGALDASFGDAGIVRADIGPAYDRAYALALQTDGKIVVAGSTYTSGEDFVALRFNSDGSLDGTFGNNGVANVGPTTETATAVCIGADGRIYLTGDVWWGLSPHTPVVCLLPNGTLDASFSNNGHVIISFALGADDGSALFVHPDGRVVVAGRAANDLRSSTELSLFQVGNNGVLDTQFGTDGRIRITANDRMDEARAIAVQPDGRILLAGRSSRNGVGEMALVRHSWQGQRDVFFGSAGRVRLDIGVGDDGAHAVVVRPDGRILVAGFAGGATDLDVCLVRLLPNGQRDSTFGTNGTVTAALGLGDDWAHAIMLDAAGCILIGGTAFNGSDKDLVAARFEADGALDLSFGNGGTVSIDAGADEEGMAMALQSDGRIVLAGSTGSGQDRNAFVVRLEADGALDVSFGSGGVVEVNAGGDDVAYALVIDTQQRIVFTGRSMGGNGEDALVARLTSNGESDPTFGATGWVLLGNGSRDECAHDVLVRTDGTLLVCGYARTDTVEDVLLMRIQPDGELDPDFFLDGEVTVAIGEGDDRAYAMALQQDGRLVVGGQAGSGPTDDFAVIRLTYPSIVMDAHSEPDRSAGCHVKPNPCGDHVTVEFEMKRRDRISMHLVDGLGAVVRDFHFGAERASGRCMEELDLTGLSPGRYTLVLLGSHHSTRADLVKQ